MQVTERNGDIILDGKFVTTLDEFVSSVVRIIEISADYVIVSGYVAILFGRARGTEDVDLIIRPLTKKQFHGLWDTLLKSGYYFLNSGNENEIVSMLANGLGVRIAREHMIIPDIELKFEKSRCDEYALNGFRNVVFGGSSYQDFPIGAADSV